MPDACNVVPLRREPEPDMVWHCACGCPTNYAHLDGTLECASCGSRHEDAGGGWRDTLPEPAQDQPAPTAEYTVVTDLNCPEMALKRLLAKANVADTVAVVLFQDAGGVSAWGSVPDTRRHRGWLNRKLATAKALPDGEAGMRHHYPTLLLIALVVLSLAGCTYTEAHYGDASLVSWRVWTDTSASVETEGMRAAYSSDADTAAAMSMNQRLLDALLGARLAAPGP